MERQVDYVPIVGKLSALKGFLSGSLMAGGLFIPYGAALQAILFIIGFLVFLDSVIPANKGIYVITTIFFLLIGTIIEFVLAATNITAASLWFILMFLLTVVIYLVRLGKLGILKR
jgi:hypothetical protein